jgi:two-component system, OmpR family, sensor kinase
MFKSMRWRLLAWHAAILSCTVAGFGAALYFKIRQARLADVDAELQAAVRTLEGALRVFPANVLEGTKGPAGPFKEAPPRKPPKGFGKPPPPPYESPARLRKSLALPFTDGQAFDDEAKAVSYFVVWLANGEIFKQANLPPDVTIPPYNPRGLPGGGVLRIRQHEHYREALIVGPKETQVLVGRSIEHEQSELYWLAWQIVLIGMGVLTVGLAGGWFLAGRTVRPIAAMSAAAAGISATNLSARIDVREVDSELGKLASILNQMFSRLEAAFERQVRFTADASHELRTPLSVMQTAAQLSLSRPRSPEEYQQSLETCLRASRRMKTIVEDLLALARTDAGQPIEHLERLDWGALVNDAVTPLAALAAEKNVTLHVQAPSLYVRGDSTKLSQVVTNLVCNGIYYNRPGGTVTVTLAAAGPEAILTVADTGCGIPDEDRPHIFERFYRVDKARSREFGGSGLGLAICKSIVQGLGGRIGFTTEVDRGTAFVVHLPRLDSHREL